jgi:cytochrome c-type biogenesis protein CcmH
VLAAAAPRQPSHASRKAINTAIYRDQIAELERDLASGALSQADYASAPRRLERRVLEDVADDGAAPAAPRRLPRTALALAVALPAAAVAVLVLGTPAALDPAAVQKASRPPPPKSRKWSRPRRQARENPDNPQGWAMLGRSYKVMGRFDDAARPSTRPARRWKPNPN